mmetsp:Transcript_42785/g.89740  ORF Transcript_42785/g.89740 Transcript_42785/m.89740 type:complete len:370 (-) Transcript_42785:191-1300(-)
MAISRALATVLLATSCALPTHGFIPPSSSHHRQPPSQGLLSSATSQKSLLHATDSAADEATKSAPSTESLTLFSPCKINLFLRIIRKRPDGFHDLASLFQAVGFGDTLHLSLATKSDDDEFSCNMAGVPTDSSNLVLRALELMRQKTDRKDVFFNADLVKRVPAQAGLGGGSANAATAMWGANELMGRPATLDQLIEWSGELGSDITFFLSRGTAYCTGRGEVMTPIDPPIPSGAKLSIVKPDLGLSTPKVFQALDYDQLSTEDPQMLCDTFLKGGVVDTKDEYYINDLEQPAFDCLPQLKALKEELLGVEGFNHVMMSGSGTSIFCIGEAADKEGFMKEFDSRKGISVFNSEFINREDGCWFEDPENN